MRHLLQPLLDIRHGTDEVDTDRVARTGTHDVVPQLTALFVGGMSRALLKFSGGPSDDYAT